MEPDQLAKDAEQLRRLLTTHGPFAIFATFAALCRELSSEDPEHATTWTVVASGVEAALEQLVGDSTETATTNAANGNAAPQRTARAQNDGGDEGDDFDSEDSDGHDGDDSGEDDSDADEGTSDADDSDADDDLDRAA